jgi:uncharacterized protein
MKETTMHYEERVRDKVAMLYAADIQSVAHRMDHIERVLANAQNIATHFPDTDTELLTLSVLLHDVTSPFNRKEEHVELSTNTARDILNEIGYPPEKSERVLSIIGEHSTERLKTGNLSSVEARILFDADKIDGLGPNGIARAFALFGQRGYAPPSAITWYRKKIETTLRNMKTVPGRKMVMERLPYVEDFLHRFEAENEEHPEKI